jgi:hypothetical protein
MKISPGDKVGIRGFDNRSSTVIGGPFTISKRSNNPLNQHMWKLTEQPWAIAETRLFHWMNGMKVGDKAPTNLNIATRNKAINQAMRNVWEERTNMNSQPGSGPLNIVRNMLGRNIKGTRSKNPGNPIVWNKTIGNNKISWVENSPNATRRMRRGRRYRKTRRN